MPTQFYRKLNPQTGKHDFYQQGTNRYIGPTEFGRGANFQEVSAPTSTQPTSPTQPTVRRDDAGGIETLTDPLTQFKNQTVFMNTAKDIIRQKQGQSQDISQAKTYWRSLIRQTSPFGGTVDPADEIPGRFTDERFRQLSPEQQASVRASRTGTAQAHLQGIAEEERYRETRTEDTLQVLRDLWQENTDRIEADKAMSKEERDTEMHELDIEYKQLQIKEKIAKIASDASAGIDSNIELTNSQKWDLIDKWKIPSNISNMLWADDSLFVDYVQSLEQNISNETIGIMNITRPGVSGEEIRAQIDAQYSQYLTPLEIDALMIQAGYIQEKDRNPFTNIVSKGKWLAPQEQ